ncbi:hypothetical protein ACFZDK_36390, partial [Streptomyces sp. NPDC007901]|uniref:hypothetical protein n=1 Tax=Streptomyces sp. NPDC007901 TaxID=3364785 RepID=UPI0036E09427
TFGTLLSSQGTVASFVLTLSGFPPGFPSVFQPYQIRFPFRFRSEFISGGRWRAFAFSVAFRLPFGESDFIRSPWPF